MHHDERPAGEEHFEDLEVEPAAAESVTGGLSVDGRAGNDTIQVDTQIVSPRDPASGLPTGKRQHKPFG